MECAVLGGRGGTLKFELGSGGRIAWRLKRVEGVRTFFPAYRPRVMMATRPTLRTAGDAVSVS